MGESTAISWTESTWNYLRGCSEEGDDCANCYAKRIGARFSGPGQPYEGFAIMKHTAGGRSIPQWTGKVEIVAEHLLDPVRWKEPRRIFCVSVSDPFHEALTNYEIAVAYGIMAVSGRHTFQNLTKRARRRREWFAWVEEEARKIDQSPAAFCFITARTWAVSHGARGWAKLQTKQMIDIAQEAPWPLPWVWEGVSVGRQKYAVERISELVRTDVAVRFLSCEPLLEALDLRFWLQEGRCRARGGGNDEHGPFRCGLPVNHEHDDEDPKYTEPHSALMESSAPWFGLGEIHWVIAGCESGIDARPCEVEWLRSLRDQCASAGVPFFLKQGRGIERNGIGGSRHMVPIARVRDGSFGAIKAGDGSKEKGGGVIELPYLDGVQHAKFPEVSRG